MMPAVEGWQVIGEITGEHVVAWLADGNVCLRANARGSVIAIPYPEWNELIERIGHREPEADKADPP